ncbi:MAG: response regulator [bacterium]|nr:response regulator [bacterium]
MQKKILLIDDEASLRRTMTLGLSQAGYDTEPCENGISGLKKLESCIKNNIRIDCLVVDIHLPDIDGIKLVKIMRHKYPEIPIILITGYADRYSMEEIRNLNVDLFLEKPFTAQEMVDQFVKIIEKPAEEEAAKEETTGASAYMLLKVNEGEGFFESYKQLHLMDPVVYCDATKGDYDIFLLVQGNTMDEIRTFAKEKVEPVEGVASVDILAVGNPVLDDSTHNVIKDAENILQYFSAVATKEKDKMVCSYILMEVEREKLQDIYPTLRLDDSVIFCDYTIGKYNLVLMLKTDYFNDIDRFISEKINVLEGVLRVKEYPIINLFEM